MKTVIVYKGKYGATRQYAWWAGEELGCPVLTADEVQEKDIAEADSVILGTSVYIGKLQITKWLKKYASLLRNKKLFLFLVAGTPPDQKEKLDAYIRAGVPEEVRQQCEIFYLPGRLVMKKLSWFDRFMLNMGARLAKDPADKKNMLTEYDHVKKEHITGLLRSAEKLYMAAEPV